MLTIPVLVGNCASQTRTLYYCQCSECDCLREVTKPDEICAACMAERHTYFDFAGATLLQTVVAERIICPSCGAINTPDDIWCSACDVQIRESNGLASKHGTHLRWCPTCEWDVNPDLCTNDNCPVRSRRPVPIPRSKINVPVASGGYGEYCEELGTECRNLICRVQPCPRKPRTPCLSSSQKVKVTLVYLLPVASGKCPCGKYISECIYPWCKKTARSIIWMSVVRSNEKCRCGRYFQDCEYPDCR